MVINQSRRGGGAVVYSEVIGGYPTFRLIHLCPVGTGLHKDGVAHSEDKENLVLLLFFFSNLGQSPRNSVSL